MLSLLCLTEGEAKIQSVVCLAQDHIASDGVGSRMQVWDKQTVCTSGAKMR
jgi:hypothetical protein